MLAETHIMKIGLLTADFLNDAVKAIYHDQGLIPLKLLDFDTTVNVTLGLPKPRTSPDHGTAFSIAGKNLANLSLIQYPSFPINPPHLLTIA